MTRQTYGEENDDANVMTDDDLLDEIFTERSVSSDKDEELVDYGENPIATTQRKVKSVATRSKCAQLLSRSESSAECLPILSRTTSQGAYFNEHFRSVDPDHTVGRTRVPWHSKSVSDLRHSDAKPTRIVAFDVGGKLFRCKESLIAKYPLKRLNQIITCGCGKISCLDDAFFVDRNPQHFEMILDWYRTGKLVRQRNINEEAFKDDAIYFDLYEELFPRTPSGDVLQSEGSSGLPTRRRSVHDVDLGRKNTKRVSMFANMPSPNASLHAQKQAAKGTEETTKEEPQDVGLPLSNDEGPLRFFRRERHVLTLTSIPLVFMIRKFEKLLVESVEGRGKLMVRVCDATGMQSVDVSEAVLFDSHSRFYLNGTRTQLQHDALLPGNHVYTFWMEGNTNDHTSTPSALDITFKLLFTFDSVDRLTAIMEAELTCATSERDAIRTLTPDSVLQHKGQVITFSPCLFMPPSHLKNNPKVILPPDAFNKKTTSTRLHKQMSPLSKMTTKGSQHYLSSPVQHAGAAIMRSSAQLPHP